MDKNRSFPSIKGTLYHFYHYLNDNCTWVFAETYYLCTRI